jgi:hypothetical protein
MCVHRYDDNIRLPTAGKYGDISGMLAFDSGDGQLTSVYIRKRAGRIAHA